MLNACSAAGNSVENTASLAKPNLVMIFIDDMGYGDLSAFGNKQVATPNIDRIAIEGLKLTQFYVNSPICSASRVALKTGRYPQRERIHSFLSSRKHNQNRKMPDYLRADAYTYAQLFQQNGYRTGHFGKWHLGGGRDVDDAPLPQAYGYHESLVSFEGLGDRVLWSRTSANQKPSWRHGQGEILELPKHQTTQTYVDRAIAFVKQNQQQPFMVNVFPNDVHDGHAPSAAQLQKWQGKGRDVTEDKFFAVLDEMDRQVGRLLDTLDELGLANNTIVILTSDNGPTDWQSYYDKGIVPPGSTGCFRGRKWSLYEGGIRMPFMIRWPERIAPGQTDRESVVAAIDMLPSFASLAGLPFLNSQQIDGEDRSTVLLGQAQPRKQPLFWEYGVFGSIEPGKPAHVSPKLAMREGDYKLLVNPDGSQAELYQLNVDSAESNNLVSQETLTYQRMNSKLQGWWSQMKESYQ